MPQLRSSRTGWIGVVSIGAALLILPLAARAVLTAEALYSSRTIVTGTREENRPAGFANCIEDVLVKVSGDAHLLDDPRLDPIKADAGRLVTAIRYHDRMEGIPHHDEQGTRDRPYDLFVTFDKDGIDAALASLGLKPWTGPRPKIAVFLGIRTARGDYVLAFDGERGIDQRESLDAAATRRGLEEALPSQAQLDARKIDFDGLAEGPPADEDRAAREAGGDRALSGTLAWNDATLGWTIQWRFRDGGQTYAWGAKGVSFDVAFRKGFEGVETIVSGHGSPPA